MKCVFIAGIPFLIVRDTAGGESAINLSQVTEIDETGNATFRIGRDNRSLAVGTRRGRHGWEVIAELVAASAAGGRSIRADINASGGGWIQVTITGDVKDLTESEIEAALAKGGDA